MKPRLASSHHTGLTTAGNVGLADGSAAQLDVRSLQKQVRDALANADSGTFRLIFPQ